MSRKKGSFPLAAPCSAICTPHGAPRGTAERRGPTAVESDGRTTPDGSTSAVAGSTRSATISRVSMSAAVAVSLVGGLSLELRRRRTCEVAWRLRGTRVVSFFGTKENGQCFWNDPRVFGVRDQTMTYITRTVKQTKRGHTSHASKQDVRPLRAAAGASLQEAIGDERRVAPQRARRRLVVGRLAEDGVAIVGDQPIRAVAHKLGHRHECGRRHVERRLSQRLSDAQRRGRLRARAARDRGQYILGHFERRVARRCVERGARLRVKALLVDHHKGREVAGVTAAHLEKLAPALGLRNSRGAGTA
eukprot:7331585-Prymnesium_polylepis.3